ncbi:MAG: hypothetical protein VB034_11490 [Eubacteriales bacterium]|nr:hypothetical protein [Eubacteriales bacterium]
MKRNRFFFAAAAVLLCLALLFGCVPRTGSPAASPTPAASAVPTTAPPTPSPTATPTASATASVTPSASPAPSAAAATPTATPSGPKMYSSYADLISYDPATGIAKFDYFDMLRGDDAVDYYVEHEGYTKAAAEALVDEFVESEFVKKNTNPQLRAIDLDDVSLKLMYEPDGEQVPDATPVASSASDFAAIYAVDPALLTESYFYYIHVEDDGHVSLVEQVYWP